MMMKKHTLSKSIFIGLFALLLSPVTNAQPKGGPDVKSDKIEALKIAFITKELELNSDEAEKFWPVYNEAANKLKAEKKSQRQLAKELHDNYATFTEADFKKKSGLIMDSELKEAQIKKEYHDKIAGIIGYKKATKLLSLEQRFKKELLNRLNNGQNNPNSRGGKPGGPRPN